MQDGDGAGGWTKQTDPHTQIFYTLQSAADKTKGVFTKLKKQFVLENDTITMLACLPVHLWIILTPVVLCVYRASDYPVVVPTLSKVLSDQYSILPEEVCTAGWS